MNKFIDSHFYKQIISGKKRCFFVSPHLDDAIFSAAGLIRELRKHNIAVTVVNVFTKPSDKPYTLSVKKFLYSCGYSDANEFYSDRIKEDKIIFNKLGVNVINLGFIDALWRRKSVKGILKFISKFIPEVDYVYPIYRSSIAKGRISDLDINLKNDIIGKIKDAISVKNSVVFYPLAIGKHVDHLIVRDISKEISLKNVYWTDYPYVKHFDVDSKYISENNLEAFDFDLDFRLKNDLINMYKTQVKAIFNTNEEKVSLHELYYQQNILS